VLAEEGAGQLAGHERRVWMNRFDLEQDNFRAALDWLTLTGRLEWGMRLGNALHLYWQDHAHQGEGSDRMRALLNLPGAAARSKTRARILFLAGSLGQAADPYYARAALREALGLYREMDDKVGAAAASTHLAVAYRDGSDYEAARSLFTEAIRLWEEAGDPVSVAHTMSNLADVVRAQGDYEVARELHGESLSIFRRLGDRAGIAWSLNHQADVAREQADMVTAGLLYEQAVMMFRELGDRTGIARSLADLGNLACDEGSYATAQRLYAEALTLFCELGEPKLGARVLESIACAAAGQGIWDRALRVAGAAAGIRQRFRFPLAAAAKANLDCRLEPAQQSLSASAAAAWIEGWSMPLEKAIEYALASETE
jgi:tetratricopeptide (TPR) repeat protein